MPVQIAIDGYSSCGKSTVAKALATRLGYTYIDTGAMYRATTLYFLRKNIGVHDLSPIQQALQEIQIGFSKDGKEVFLNGENVSDEIRQMHVAEKVSSFSSIKEVRAKLVQQQQEIGKKQSVVMDGRDIGTVVFPQATLKIFMTADPHIRAERRYKELQAKGESVSMEAIFQNLQQRDHEDTTRKESPLTQASDAIILDNSHLDQEQQLQFVIDRLPQDAVA